MLFQIKQRVFSLGGAFDITDDAGNVAYIVQGRVLSLGQSLDFFDAQQQPLAHIQQRLLSFTPTYDITQGGQLALTVHKQAFTWNPHFDAEGPAGIYTMNGDWTDWNFQVACMGRVVAQISRQFSVFADCYGVDVAEGADAPTILCLAIVMDEIIHSR